VSEERFLININNNKNKSDFEFKFYIWGKLRYRNGVKLILIFIYKRIVFFCLKYLMVKIFTGVINFKNLF